MNLCKLVAAFILRRPLTWSFHLLTLSLGVAMVIALAALNTGLSNRFTRDLAGVDLVVGAKGSPLQLILSSVFQLDAPTGNIPLATPERLSKNMVVKQVVPLALGDNVGGHRLVGTTPRYAALYGAKLSAGRWWTGPMQAVLGAETARDLKLTVGATFFSAHGLSGGPAHRATPYRVVGVLAPTGAVVDRVAMTDVASVWRAHATETDPEAPKQITAVLVSYRSAMGAVMLPPMIAAQPDLQAASPAVEAARLTKLLGVGADLLQALGIGVLALAGLGFFVALFAAVSERRRELVLLRVLGAGRSLLFGVVALEALTLGLTGGVIGLALGRAAAAFTAARAVASGGPALILPPVGAAEALALAGAAAISLLAALGPAAMAYRIRIASTVGA
jgi:putative ABC transport system permease protein